MVWMRLWSSALNLGLGEQSTRGQFRRLRNVS